MKIQFVNFQMQSCLYKQTKWIGCEIIDAHKNKQNNVQNMMINAFYYIVKNCKQSYSNTMRIICIQRAQMTVQGYGTLIPRQKKLVTCSRVIEPSRSQSNHIQSIRTVFRPD